MKTGIITSLIVITIMAILACIIWVGVRQTEARKITNHAFHVGELVRAKIDNRRGMVIAVYQFHHAYDVRFPMMRQTTQTRVLSDDHAIMAESYGTVKMYEFELDPEPTQK